MPCSLIWSTWNCKNGLIRRKLSELLNILYRISEHWKIWGDSDVGKIVGNGQNRHQHLETVTNKVRLYWHKVVRIILKVLTFPCSTGPSLAACGKVVHENAFLRKDTKVKLFSISLRTPYVDLSKLDEATFWISWLKTNIRSQLLQLRAVQACSALAKLTDPKTIRKIEIILCILDFE